MSNYTCLICQEPVLRNQPHLLVHYDEGEENAVPIQPMSQLTAPKAPQFPAHLSCLAHNPPPPKSSIEMAEEIAARLGLESTPTQPQPEVNKTTDNCSHDWDIVPFEGTECTKCGTFLPID